MLRPEIFLLLVVLVIIGYLIWVTYIRRKTKNGKSTNLITCSRIGNNGNLGNQLFQAAAVIGVAHSNNCGFVLPTSAKDASIGKLVSFRGVNFMDTHPHKTIKEETEGVFRPIEVPNNNRVYDIEGYFQTHLYFQNAMAAVQKALEPKVDVIMSALRRAPKCNASNTIGVHVRRGDYLSDTYKDWFTQCPATYYTDAVAKLRQQYKKAHVFICSDDIAWCKKHLKIENSTYVETGPAQEDFVILWLCQHQVMANSSFSWWSAYLKSNIVPHSIIAPYPWYNPRGPKAHLNVDDIYYPLWTVTPVDKGPVYRTARVVALSHLYDQRMALVAYNNSISPLYGKTYVISLDTAKDRWQSAKDILTHAGIKPTLFPAIDKNVIAQCGGRQGLKKMGLIEERNTDLDFDGTIGCGLSHMAVWAAAVRDGLDRVTVFEDDIESYISEQSLTEKVEEAMRTMDKDWDILFLGKCIDRCELYVKVADGIYKTRDPRCAHAYIISSSGIKKVLTRALYTAIDTQLGHDILDDVLKAYTFHPSLFVQNIVKWSSSLRSYKAQIHNAIECAYIED